MERRDHQKRRQAEQNKERSQHKKILERITKKGAISALLAYIEAVTPG
ncbi:hypothetical protein [Escherichia phage vB-Eco-KMB37]|nr:hypothetical protein [Escherichia phage vB-Eco-KMB37]